MNIKTAVFWNIQPGRLQIFQRNTPAPPS